MKRIDFEVTIPRRTPADRAKFCLRDWDGRNKNTSNTEGH